MLLLSNTQMVKNEFDDDYDVNVKYFQFDTFSRNDPSIAIEFQRLLPQGWTASKEATYQQVEIFKLQMISGWSFQYWIAGVSIMRT